jgi:hypothetical protein
MVIQWVIFYFFGWASLLSMGFVMFRFKLLPYMKQIILSSLLLDFISVLLQSYNEILLIATIQPISAILCYWLIFRIRWLYAIIITIAAYLINFILEDVMTLVVTRFKMDEFRNVIRANDDLTIAVFIIFIDLLICFALSKYRIGFTFIPRHSIKPLAFLRQNRRLVTSFFITLLIMMLSSFSLFYFHSNIALLVKGFVILLWFVILREAYQKETFD